MGNFVRVIDFIFPKRKAIHIFIILASGFMLPGFMATLTPIDIESYNLFTSFERLVYSYKN